MDSSAASVADSSTLDSNFESVSSALDSPFTSSELSFVSSTFSFDSLLTSSEPLNSTPASALTSIGESSCSDLDSFASSTSFEDSFSIVSAIFSDTVSVTASALSS